jgi:hypothetical protein
MIRKKFLFPSLFWALSGGEKEFHSQLSLSKVSAYNSGVGVHRITKMSTARIVLMLGMVLLPLTVLPQYACGFAAAPCHLV